MSILSMEALSRSEELYHCSLHDGGFPGGQFAREQRGAWSSWVLTLITVIDTTVERDRNFIS